MWSYWMELWGCASKFNIVITQRSQSISYVYWTVHHRTSWIDWTNLMSLYQVCSIYSTIPIQNSQSHSKRNLLCNKSYSTCRLQHPLRDVIHERINKHHNKPEAHPNPLLQPIQQPVNTSRLKQCWPLDMQGTWGDFVGWIPRHCNTWYRNVLCIIVTLAYRLCFYDRLCSLWGKRQGGKRAELGE